MPYINPSSSTPKVPKEIKENDGMHPIDSGSMTGSTSGVGAKQFKVNQTHKQTKVEREAIPASRKGGGIFAFFKNFFKQFSKSKKSDGSQEISQALQKTRNKDYMLNLESLVNVVNQNYSSLEGLLRISPNYEKLNKMCVDITKQKNKDFAQELNKMDLDLFSHVLKRNVIEINKVFDAKELTPEMAAKLKPIVGEIYTFVEKIVNDPVTRLNWKTFNLATKGAFIELFQNFKIPLSEQALESINSFNSAMAGLA